MLSQQMTIVKQEWFLKKLSGEIKEYKCESM